MYKAQDLDEKEHFTLALDMYREAIQLYLQAVSELLTVLKLPLFSMF